MLNFGFNPCWATPVLREKIADEALVAALCAELLAITDLAAPYTRYQGEQDIFTLGPQLQRFKQEVVLPTFERYLQHWGASLADFEGKKVQGWVTGMRSGYFVPRHNHSNAVLSSVFYLLIDDSIGEDGNGDLVLSDPRGNANRGLPPQLQSPFADLAYTPKSGEAVVFPGFVYHHTIPTRS